MLQNALVLGVENGTFTHNSAGWSGGAVCFRTEDALEAAFSGTTMQRNSAGDGGGALYSWGPVTLTVDSSAFSENEAGGAAGAIGVLYARETMIRSTTFESNVAQVLL